MVGQTTSRIQRLIRAALARRATERSRRFLEPTRGWDATSVDIYAWHIANGMLMIGNASVGKVARSGHPA